MLAGYGSALEEISVIESRRAPLDALIDRALFMSSTSPSRLGERAPALAAD
jgi:hypothetical protein